jgi:UDP-glucuronate 4-epimerase
MTRRALVTGGAGFVGSHLVDALLAEGWRVTAVDNFDRFYSREAKELNIAAHRPNANFSLVELDIADANALQERVRESFDVVVHLAAKAGVRPSIENPIAYQDANVRGTQNVLELCRAIGVQHVVFASSSSVYGVNPNVPWCENDHVLLPISPYASTKVSAELLGHVYSRLYGIRFLALRLFTVYGPRQRPDLAIHKFARSMLDGATIPCFGDGSSRRDYTYVDDVVKGIRAAMDYTATSYEVINIGNSSSVGLHELIKALEDVLQVRALTRRLPNQPGDVPITWADSSKAERLLGFRPNTRLGDGLERFAEWLRAYPIARAIDVSSALIAEPRWSEQAARQPATLGLRP